MDKKPQNTIIDLQHFIRNTQSLSDKICLNALVRLQELHHNIAGILEYKLTSYINNKNRAILGLLIHGKIIASCQNCLNSMELDIDVDTEIPVFNAEEELNDFSDNNDIDECAGVVVSPSFDLIPLIEDEIIVAIPIAPKHQECPNH